MESKVSASIPDDLEFGAYKFDAIIGQGGEAIACRYIRQSDRRIVAVKIDPVIDRNIAAECTFMRENCDGKKLTRAPKYILHNTFGGGRRYVIMEYLEYSVEEYLSTIKNQAQRDQEISRLAIEMLHAVRELHELGYIHRDIKNMNFRVHNGQVYIIDFGLKQQY